QRRGKVNVQDELIERRAGLDEFGITHQKRVANGFVISPTLVTKTMFSPKETIVAREDHQSVLQLVGSFQSVEELTESFVHGCQRAQLIANGFLRDMSAVAPAFARLSLLRRFWLLRCRIFQRPRRRRLAFERIVETRRGLDGLVGVKLLVPLRRREGAV